MTNEFTIFVQAASRSPVGAQHLFHLTVGALRSNTWCLPNGVDVRIYEHNLIIGRFSARVILRSVFHVALDPSDGHHTMEREILHLLLDAPAHLIPLRRVVNGRRPDAVWWLSQTSMEAFMDGASPSIELCEIAAVEPFEGPQW